MSRVPARSTTALELAAGAAFVLLLFVLPGPIAPMGIATALCTVLTLAAFVRAPRPAWPRTPVTFAGWAWFAALLLAALTAYDRSASLPRISKGLMPILVSLAAFHAADQRRGERALAAFLVASALVAAIGLGLWVQHGASFASRARGLSGHYMTFAGQLLLEVPVALGVAMLTRSPRWRVGASLTALLGVAALVVTFTRSAWIGLFVAGAVLLGAVAPVGLVALAALAVAAYLFAPGTFRDRIHSAFDPSHPWNRERVHMWDAGLRMFRDHPLTGVGLQDMHELYDRYRSPDSVERAGHLHNAFVQIAASMGAVGLAAFAWLYTALVWTAASGLKPLLTQRGLAAGLKLGVLAALAGFLVAGCFEWNFGDEELLYPLYLLVGLAWGARHWEERGA